jgi:alpha-beta hydrolase superfamily lysophospholipase
VNAYKNDPLVLKYFYVSIVGQMFISGVNYLHKNVANMSVPTLFLHGKDDLIVSRNFSKELYDKLPITDKKIVIYDDTRHEIFNEPKKHIAVADSIKWFNEHE